MKSRWIPKWILLLRNEFSRKWFGHLKGQLIQSVQDSNESLMEAVADVWLLEDNITKVVYGAYGTCRAYSGPLPWYFYAVIRESEGTNWTTFFTVRILDYHDQFSKNRTKTTWSVCFGQELAGVLVLYNFRSRTISQQESGDRSVTIRKPNFVKYPKLNK